jgi:hypothetical protein
MNVMMPKNEATDVPIQSRATFCSFCGRGHTESGPHVEGPRDVYICESCVVKAQSIFNDMRDKRMTWLEARVKRLESQTRS